MVRCGTPEQFFINRTLPVNTLYSQNLSPNSNVTPVYNLANNGTAPTLGSSIDTKGLLTAIAILLVLILVVQSISLGYQMGKGRSH